MILTYDAIDHRGQRKSAIVEAADAQHAVVQLKREGLYVTHIEESAPSVSSSAPREVQEDVRLPLKTLVVFTRQMAMLLRAGSGVVPALTAIRRQTKKPVHAALLGRLISDLEDGLPLTDALRRFPNVFDSVYCAVVAAGEASATLPEMFDRVASIMTRRRTLRNQIIGALAYPALLVTMSINIIISLLLFVIPRFNDMFTQLGVDPPASTRMLLGVANVLTEYWLLAVAAVAAMFAGAIATLASTRGRQWIADVQIAVPLLGPLRSSLIQGQVMRTMGTLLESRVGILQALALSRGSTRNRRYQRLFDDVEKAVTSGGQLGATFERSGLVQAYVCQAVITGEDCGNLGGAMTYAADMLDETNSELINTVMKLVEPIILIVMGVVVGGVAITLFLPLFDLTAALQ